jgi:hypothetical protein
MDDLTTTWLRLVLAVLATWRIAHLLTAEDGPAGVVAALRGRLGRSVAGSAMDCFGCMSLWIGLPFGLYVTGRPLDLFFTWLALSGGAFLLERSLPPPLTIRAVAEPERGDLNDELLRTPSLRRDTPSTGGEFGGGSER